MTETALTTEQTFQENIKNRLRKEIGDLIPDAVLTEMVNKSIKDIFFTKKEIPGSYGREKIVEPSWFDVEVKTLLSPTIKECISSYFQEHKDEIGKLIAEAIVKDSPLLIGAFLVDVISRKVDRVADKNDSLVEALRNYFNNGIKPIIFS